MRRSNSYLMRALLVAVGGGAVLTAAGCTNLQPRKSHSSATTTTSDQVKLADAIAIDEFESDDMQVIFTDKLSSPQVIKTVYFGEADEFSSDDDQTPTSALPLIGIKVGDDWKAVALAGPGLRDAGWKYVGAGPGRHEVWGVLDTSAGDSRANFVVAHSSDGAQSFTLKVFRKPCKLATVADFAMSRSGTGRVTVSLDTDCDNAKAGLYHYETNDDGKTWSKSPSYEPDAMIRADTVPDDEQPDQGPAPTRTLFIHKSSRPSARTSR